MEVERKRKEDTVIIRSSVGTVQILLKVLSQQTTCVLVFCVWNRQRNPTLLPRSFHDAASSSLAFKTHPVLWVALFRTHVFLSLKKKTTGQVFRRQTRAVGPDFRTHSDTCLLSSLFSSFRTPTDNICVSRFFDPCLSVSRKTFSARYGQRPFIALVWCHFGELSSFSDTCFQLFAEWPRIRGTFVSGPLSV